MSRGRMVVVLLLTGVVAVEVGAGETASRFVRGDVNDDFQVTITDGIYVLRHQFVGDVTVRCNAAADVNDDLGIELTDAVYLFVHLFLGGSPPAAPYPRCGGDPRAEGGLTCLSYPGCSDGEVLKDAGTALDETPVRAEDPLIDPLPGARAAPQLDPEILRVLMAIAPGESIHALSGLSGYEDFLAGFFGDEGSGAVLSRVPTYEPGITVEATSGDDECLTFSEAARSVLGRELSVARGASETEILEVIPGSVCGTGEHRVVVMELTEHGDVLARGARVVLGVDREGPAIDVAVASEEAYSCSGPVSCKWYAGCSSIPDEPQKVERQREWGFWGYGVKQTQTFDAGLAQGNDGVSIINGTACHHELRGQRKAANCSSPETQESEGAVGSYSCDFRFVCLDSDELVCDPAECQPQARTIAAYASKVVVETNAQSCWFDPESIEFLGRDEVRFTVDDSVCFNKGVSVQTGNDVTTEVSFAAGAGVGRDGDGTMSGEAGLRFGYSEIVQHDTGKKSAWLTASATKTIAKREFTLDLWSHAGMTMNAENKTMGTVEVETDYYYVTYVLTSPGCPEVAPLVGGVLHTFDESRQKELKGRLVQFLEVNLAGYDVDSVQANFKVGE